MNYYELNKPVYHLVKQGQVVFELGKFSRKQEMENPDIFIDYINTKNRTKKGNQDDLIIIGLYGNNGDLDLN